jgi:hypothetical protein
MHEEFKKNGINLIITEKTEDSYIFNYSLLSKIANHYAEIIIKIDDDFNDFLKNQDKFNENILNKIINAFKIDAEEISIISVRSGSVEYLLGI